LDDIGFGKGMRRACRKRNWFHHALLALCLSFPPSFFSLSLSLFQRNQRRRTHLLREKKNSCSPAYISLEKGRKKKEWWSVGET
jgi:hypothetical protein